MAKSIEIHDQLWEESMLAFKDANHVATELMSEALTELVDTQVIVWLIPSIIAFQGVPG